MTASRTDTTAKLAVLELPQEYDLAKTLWLAGMGHRDPTLRLTDTTAQIAYHTPEGPVSVTASREHATAKVTAVGPGTEWIEPRLSCLFGLQDRPKEFQPGGKLGELVRTTPGIHLPKLPVVFHRLVQIVLQQLVSWSDAVHGWRQIVDRFGTKSPCGELRLPPTAKQLSTLGYYDIVGCNVMPKQARLILHLAREAKRIERLAERDVAALETYLLSIRGIGPWTVQHLLGSSLGFADAVLTGDFGLPHSVAYFLVGKERSDDEEMLRLLEPYAGHRFRVINHLWQSGLYAPRRGPRMQTNRWRYQNRRSS